MHKRLLSSILIAILSCSQLLAQDYAVLRNQIQKAITGYHAKIGVAIIVDGKDTLTVNNDEKYPMMSVYKFHQALAVGQALQKKNIPLDSMMYISKSDLRPDTYSPLYEKYPEGNVFLPISELLVYTLQLSDNNACDILFDRLLNVKQTDAAIRAMKVKNFKISATEKEMQHDIQRCYDNWSTPLASAILLENFVEKKIVAGEYYDFILKTMLDCTTGQNRLSAGLPKDKVRIGHKTGTSGRNSLGKYMGVNDIGFVLLPDGRHYSVAVYVKDSAEILEINEKVIADISHIIYMFLSK